MHIFADFHTHTLYSHGKGTVEENLLAGKARGLEMVGITDHGPGSTPWVRATVGRIRRLIDEVGYYNERMEGMRALAGVESNVVSLRGEIDVPPELIEELDLLLVGFHTQIVARSLADQWKIFGRTALSRYSTALRERERVEVTKALVEIVERHPVDIVTHPGLRVSIDTAELARACARRNTALEINAGHGFMTRAFAEVAARESASFAIDSDAHRPGDVGRLERAVNVALAAGLQPEQIWNARGDDGQPRPGEGLPQRPGRARPSLDTFGPPRRIGSWAPPGWTHGVYNSSVDTAQKELPPGGRTL
ncbi:MAG: PHP domain-containing protein [Bacillota bacterium]